MPQDVHRALDEAWLKARNARPSHVHIGAGGRRARDRDPRGDQVVGDDGNRALTQAGQEDVPIFRVHVLEYLQNVHGVIYREPVLINCHDTVGGAWRRLVGRPIDGDDMVAGIGKELCGTHREIGSTGTVRDSGARVSRDGHVEVPAADQNHLPLWRIVVRWPETVEVHRYRRTPEGRARRRFTVEGTGVGLPEVCDRAVRIHSTGRRATGEGIGIVHAHVCRARDLGTVAIRRLEREAVRAAREADCGCVLQSSAHHGRCPVQRLGGDLIAERVPNVRIVYPRRPSPCKTGVYGSLRSGGRGGIIYGGDVDDRGARGRETTRVGGLVLEVVLAAEICVRRVDEHVVCDSRRSSPGLLYDREGRRSPSSGSLKLGGEGIAWGVFLGGDCSGPVRGSGAAGLTGRGRLWIAAAAAGKKDKQEKPQER